MPTNRLAGEKSPYLLQHAHNPVDWFAWGEEAFTKARQEDKPIFLSIGYSTCHWCHVMERESFESEEMAAVLNRYFVPIKVDREERPDVDRIYMMFVQATTGSGGWPMSVWLTPDLKPFFGGTYFPPDNRYGRPGFAAVLQFLGEKWRTDRTRILQSSADVMEQLQSHAEVKPQNAGLLDQAVLDSGYAQFRRSFDGQHGGFGAAPKFPRVVTHNFLFRYYAQTKNRDAAEMVLATLYAMARGGINDQLGGGFHRYSVDARWFVPHFEKMLYDQAQLAASYLEGYQIAGDPFLADVARDVLHYVLREMTHPDGGFYSAEDADSVIDPAHPHEKGEGAFYVWTRAELDQRLGREAADVFAFHYGVEDNGNVLPQEDPHQEFTGKNILYEAHGLEETAAQFSLTPEQVRASLSSSRTVLLQARAQRVRPHLDDKILTAWNGLMISAFAKAAQVLEDPSYLQAAQRAAAFTRNSMWDTATGVLRRRFREGDAAIDGFLDDYAFFTQALLDLYEADFNVAHLELAVRLTDKMIELFADEQDGGFFSTAAGDPHLVLRIKEDYDGAEPSGNSIAALNLLRLGHVLQREDYRQRAERTLSAFASRLRSAAATVPQMMAALLYLRSVPQQVVFAGDLATPPGQELLRAARADFRPFRAVLALSSDQARAFFARTSPNLAEMTPVNGQTAAYVCQNFACQLPVTGPEALRELLQ